MLQLRVIAASMEAVAAAAAGGQLAAATVIESNKRKEDHRQLPRSSRRKFRHDLALECIEKDYIGDTPLLGVEFKLMFRLSRGRFQVLMEDAMASDIKFFKLTGRDGRHKSSLAARLLLPLKTLAYGVPPHTFIDYFQMSPHYARECCKEIDNAMRTIYMNEFLRLPTATDLKNIVKLHKAGLHTHILEKLSQGLARIVQRKRSHPLSWSPLQTTFCSCGMHRMGTLAP
jgi:hypothetical protein